MPADLCLLTPFENGHAGEFRAVIRDKRPGLSAAGDNSVQFSRDPYGRTTTYPRPGQDIRDCNRQSQPEPGTDVRP